MLALLTLHKLILEPHIAKGKVCVDFTMGNGHDTLFLSKSVGEEGKVYAFDIQEQAVNNTRALLESENAPNNYTLILDSHAKVKEYVKEGIDIGMFNLGWLPGADKKITTLRPSTMEAIQGALELLNHDGIIIMAIYPGHDEGKLEGEMLYDYFSSISRFEYCIGKFHIVNSPQSPYFFTIEKK